MISDICIRCLKFSSHSRENCTTSPVICCSKCFRLNYLTRDCCLPKMYLKNVERPQVFRMVGVQKNSLLY